MRQIEFTFERVNTGSQVRRGEIIAVETYAKHGIYRLANKSGFVVGHDAKVYRTKAGARASALRQSGQASADFRLS